MSNYLSKRILSLLVLCTLLSCGSTNLLTMGVIEPAPVFLDTQTKNIGIVNRSGPSETNRNLDEIDKILSAEGKNLDKRGADQAVNAVFDRLSVMKSTYDDVVLINDEGLRKVGLGKFPAPLGWEEIEAMCQKYEVDAILELAFYDTDAKIDYKLIDKVIKSPIGVDIPVKQHQATINTLIKTGWRIYEPKFKTIRDSHTLNRSVVAQGIGLTPVKAVEALVDRKEKVLTASLALGKTYANRILPYSRRVSRDYFVKGTDNFEIAKRRAQAGQWNSAAELWEQELTHSDPKIAGRAYYNMAIINEINGKLKTAVEYAQKSYTDFDNKTALPYIKVLKRRIENNKLLFQ